MKRTAAAVLAASLLLPAAPAEAVAPPAVWGVVGDSITAGAGTSDPSKAFPGVAGVPALGAPGQMLTASLVWAPLTKTFATELGQLRAEDGVNAVVVQIGINDLHLNKPDRTLITAYKKLAKIGRANGFRVVLTTITPFGPAFAATRAMKRQRVRLNDWIRTRTYYVDFAKALGGKVLKAEYDSGDGLHPGDAGHARLAAVLASWCAAHPHGLSS